MYFMDMHCHILPGVDDGSKNTEMSMEMLHIAYGQGIRKMVLTPHYYLGKTEEKAPDFQRIFDGLAPLAHEKYPDLELYLGNEIYYSPGILEALKLGNICTMAGSRYVLIEFSPRDGYRVIYQAVRELVSGGYRPVIAHMERYHCLTNHVDRVEELIKNGAYMQMNADSLTGSIFDAHNRWCRRMVLEGYISMLGTDAHDLEERTPCVEQTVRWLEKKLSSEALNLLLHGNGELLVQDKRLQS